MQHFALEGEEHWREGVTLRVCSPAKMVADGFKLRYKIGRDVALEALRAMLRHQRANVDDIWRYGERCHGYVSGNIELNPQALFDGLTLLPDLREQKERNE